MQSIILDEKWQKFLANEPETGMGFQEVNLSMQDGSFEKSIVLNGKHLMVDKTFPVGSIKSMEVSR